MDVPREDRAERSIGVVSGLLGRRRVTRIGLILLILTLLMPLAARPGAAEGKPDRIHPLLAKMAGERPNDRVRVIIQGPKHKEKLASDIRLEGGRVLKALPIIGGLVAEMPAKAVPALARRHEVSWITVDAPMRPTLSTENLDAAYPRAVRAPEVWNGTTSFTGAGVTAAVVDSGIDGSSRDFATGNGMASRIVASLPITTSGAITETGDRYGHGTHVAGIIASNGDASRGKYIGIAPDAQLIDVRVTGAQGMGYLSDVVDGIQWVVLNRAQYNIRIVNLSLVSSVAESYLTSPLDAAVEIAWLSGIVVVVSSGNQGPDTVLYPPANDPFVITVGAVDDNGSADIVDDKVADWSSYGTTQDGFRKPEVAAPGRRIVSNLASSSSGLAAQFPDRIVDGSYIRLSGTSMAAPVVSGIAALALQAHPDWTPDQIKAALMATARPLATAGSGRGEVDAAAVVSTATPGYANDGLPFSNGVAGIAGTGIYGAATWSSATWSSATWSSATWSSATWSSATWSSAAWNSATWSSATWSSTTSFPD